MARNKYEVGQLIQVNEDEYNFVGVITEIKIEDSQVSGTIYYRVLAGTHPIQSDFDGTYFDIGTLWDLEYVRILDKSKVTDVLYGK